MSDERTPARLAPLTRVVLAVNVTSAAACTGFPSAWLILSAGRR